MVFSSHQKPSSIAGTSYPYDGVHLWGGDLLGPLYGCQDLLLVLEMVWGVGVKTREGK